MRRPSLTITVICMVLMSFGGNAMASDGEFTGEKAIIKSVIEASIGWALNKDFALLYNSVAQDSSLFIYHPDSASTIVGFEAFKRHVETLFKGEQFKAVRFEVKDLRLGMTRSGEAAWFSCLLDDFGEWNGQLMGWENCRWTGTLEKRDGKWVIVQMHFSFPTDRVSEEEKQEVMPTDEADK